MMDKYSQPVTYRKAYKPYNNPAQAGRATKREYAPLDWTRVDVVAAIEKHTSTRLSSKGRTQLNGPCPFPDCSSSNDGFVVWPDGSPRSTEKSIIHYFCRNCPEDRRSGDVIKLLRLLYPDWTFQQTLTAIGMRDEEGNAVQGPPVTQRIASENTWLREQLTMLQGYYHDLQVALATFERPQLYLQSRGISLQDAQRYGLGYYPLREETRHKADDPHVASWAGRIIFPLSSPDGELTFEGRTLLLWQEGMTPEQHIQAIEDYNASCEDDKLKIRPKLKTSPCGNFGYAEAIKSSSLVVCEGPFDALSLSLAGIQNVVAMGTSLPAKSLPLSVERVTLALDSDAPGKEAAKRLASGLADRGIEVQTVLPLSGKDWNDTHVQDGLPAIVQAFILPASWRPSPRSPEEEPEPLLCSNCGKDARYIDTFYFSANGTPYCSQVCEDQDTRSQVIPSEKEDQSEPLISFAQAVSAIAGIFGTCKIEPIERGTTLAMWLKQQGIPFTDEREYTPVTLPALPRSRCPHHLFKETRDTLRSVPCSAQAGSSGWCPEHEQVALLLSLAAQAGYPEMHISESLCILAGVASWESFACIAAESVPIKRNYRTIYTEPQVKRVLPRLRTMLEQRARAARESHIS